MVVRQHLFQTSRELAYVVLGLNGSKTNKGQRPYCEKEEYKYLSPVLFYTKTGEVVGLHSVALTNTPNLDNLPEAT
ncbi:phage protease (plasmid) [Acinetobacter baumannii]